MKRLAKTILMAAIGYAIGYVIGMIAETSGFDDGSVATINGILFAGLPFGWSFLSRIFGEGIMICDGAIGITILALKCAASVILGWIILVVEFAISIYEVIRDIRYMRAAA